MAEKKNGSMWNTEAFEDISSHSRGANVIKPDFQQSRYELPPVERSSAPRAPISIEERYDMGLFAGGTERRPSAPRRTQERERSKPREKARTGEKAKSAETAKPNRQAARRKVPPQDLPEWELPERQISSGRRPQQPDPQARSGPEKRPKPSPAARKRPRKPLSDSVRRTAVTAIVLVMAAATVYLAISLLFKVTSIQITGDVIEGYSDQQVLDICGYRLGENLVLLSTKKQEAALQEKMPYIGKARIVRHFPSTLEIRLTAATAAACVVHDGGWLYVSSEGKILEYGETPLTGTMWVSGLTLGSPVVGQQLSEAELDPAEAAEGDAGGEDNTPAAGRKNRKTYTPCQAFGIILDKLTELSAAGDFTLLDLNDMSNIRLLYQNRVEFLLGSAVELGYKVEFGYSKAVPDLGAKETGVLDLSYADETSKAFFTPGEIDTSFPAGAGGQPVQDIPVLPDAPVEAPEEPDSGGARGDGIPDEIFSGNAPENGGGPEE